MTPDEERERREMDAMERWLAARRASDAVAQRDLLAQLQRLLDELERR